MRSKYRRFVTCLATTLALFCVLQLAGKALAQDSPDPEPGAAPAWRHGAPPGLDRFHRFADRFRDGAQKNKEELAELIELVRAWRMMKEVGLSEEETLRTLKLGREMKGQAGKIRKQREHALRELKKLVDDPGAKDEAIAKQLQNIERIDDRQRKLVREYERRMRSGLTVRQQAKRELFKTRFEGDLRRHIEHIRRQHGGALREKRREGRHPPAAPTRPGSMPPSPAHEPPPGD